VRAVDRADLVKPSFGAASTEDITRAEGYRGGYAGRWQQKTVRAR
jgi:hypothetical protein